MDEDSKKYAFLATFLSIIGFVIAMLTKKDDKYVMFYAKQGLIIFLFYIVVVIFDAFVEDFFWNAPHGIQNSAHIFTLVIDALLVIAWLISWIFALSGKEKVVPVLGQIGKKMKF
jgi:uncharacterized membrane protein